MFVSADQECSGLPNSTDAGSSAAVAANSAAAISLYDQMFGRANTDWLSLLSRSWQSYASFGPQVGIQLLNGQPTINAESIATGVIVSDPSEGTQSGRTASGSPGSSGPGSGPGSGGSRAGSGPTPDEMAFVRYFGAKPEFQTYTGPLPKAGSSMSLVMGGQNRALPVGPGRYAASTPDQRYGYSSRCVSPAGVVTDSAALPGPASTAGGILAVLGVLALAGLGYWADHESRKRGRA